MSSFSPMEAIAKQWKPSKQKSNGEIISLRDVPFRSFSHSFNVSLGVLFILKVPFPSSVARCAVIICICPMVASCVIRLRSITFAKKKHQHILCIPSQNIYRDLAVTCSSFAPFCPGACVILLWLWISTVSSFSASSIPRASRFWWCAIYSLPIKTDEHERKQLIYAYAQESISDCLL